MHRLIALPAAVLVVLFSLSSSPWAAAAATASAQCFGIQAYCVADASSLAQAASVPVASAKNAGAKPASQAEQDFQTMVAQCRSTYVPPSALPALARGQKGGWYYTPCAQELGTPSQVDGPLSFIPDSAVVASVITLALQARQELALPAPLMFSSPGPSASVPKAVNFPTWAWVNQTAWKPASATASAPGVAVTVTATPLNTRWSWGDGSSSTCQGPGVPYRAGYSSPGAASPDCGHTYVVTSRNEASSSFPVTAMIHWQVGWQATTGRSGRFADMSTSATQSWPVEELDALNVPTR